MTKKYITKYDVINMQLSAIKKRIYVSASDYESSIVTRWETEILLTEKYDSPSQSHSYYAIGEVYLLVCVPCWSPSWTVHTYSHLQVNIDINRQGEVLWSFFFFFFNIYSFIGWNIVSTIELIILTVGSNEILWNLLIQWWGKNVVHHRNSAKNIEKGS